MATITSPKRLDKMGGEVVWDERVVWKKGWRLKEMGVATGGDGRSRWPRGGAPDS